MTLMPTNDPVALRKASSTLEVAKAPPTNAADPA